jgi:HEPN domain-containing protein
MSQSQNRYQAERWFRTAEDDVRAAKILLSKGMHAHASFHAQQAGEKAMQALWRLTDAQLRSSSVKRLLAEFPREMEFSDLDNLLEKASLLDQYYIPTRYPNGLPDLTPGDVYGKEDALRGIEAAKKLLEAARKWLEAGHE